MRDNFDTHKWFKKQYIEESMSPEEYAKAKEAERLENNPEKDKIKDIQAMMDRERSLKEDTDILESQFDDLYQVIRNIHHVGEFENIKVAAEEAVQRIGEEFGVNFEYGRG
jgi:hypothetical protein